MVWRPISACGLDKRNECRRRHYVFRHRDPGQAKQFVRTFDKLRVFNQSHRRSTLAKSSKVMVSWIGSSAVGQLLARQRLLLPLWMLPPGFNLLHVDAVIQCLERIHFMPSSGCWIPSQVSSVFRNASAVQSVSAVPVSGTSSARGTGYAHRANRLQIGIAPFLLRHHHGACSST